MAGEALSPSPSAAQPNFPLVEYPQGIIRCFDVFGQ